MGKNRPTVKKSDYYFSNKDETKDIGKRTLHGGLASVGGQLSQFLLSIGSLAVLARILDPADFGLVGMVTIVVSFANEFSNFGLTMATVQRREINEAQISTLFWFNILLTTIAALIVCGLAPLISAFYDRPQLTDITLVLALTIFISGLGIQHRALLMRKYKFMTISVIGIISNIVGAVVAIVCALKGAGYWALVIRQLVTQLVLTVGQILVTHWVPQWPQRGTGVRPFLKYGVSMAGHKVIMFCARNMDTVLIGKFIGAAALGYYSQAYRIILMPLQQINAPLNRPIIASLSRLQEDPEAYRKMYRQFMAILGYLTISIIAFLAIAAKEVVLIILGPGWLEVVPIFIALLPLAYIFATIGADSIVYASLGTTDRQLRWSLYTAPIIVLFMIVGIQWGVIGVAAAASASWVLLRPLSLMYCYKNTAISLVDYFASTTRPTLLALIVAVVTYLICMHPLLQEMQDIFVAILIKATIFGLILIILDALIPGQNKGYQLLQQGQRLLLKKP